MGLLWVHRQTQFGTYAVKAGNLTRFIETVRQCAIAHRLPRRRHHFRHFFDAFSTTPDSSKSRALLSVSQHRCIFVEAEDLSVTALGPALFAVGPKLAHLTGKRLRDCFATTFLQRLSFSVRAAKVSLVPCALIVFGWKNSLHKLFEYK